MIVPFSRPYITGKELDNIKNLINNIGNGWVISGDGEYTRRVSKFIEKKFGVKKCLMTTSCTGALEMATRLLDLRYEDEIICPSFTFVSTVNPILMCGGKIVFADIREDNGLNIDPNDIRRKITDRTKAIYIVHYAGVACEMDEIMEIAKDNGIKIIEDAAHGVNAKYISRKGKSNHKYLGTIGDLGCYSFHDTKNYVCGEGGALLINTDDKSVWERAEIIREKGTDRSKFFRGEVNKYSWVDIGSSYLPSDILMAFLYGQFENGKLEEISEKRMKIYNRYNDVLEHHDSKISLPVVPDYAEHNAHLYYILFDNEMNRDNVMRKLKEKGIHATFHYLPLHTSLMGQKFGYKEGDLKITESVSNRLLRLPMYAGMIDEELEYVCNTLNSILVKI